MSVLVIWMSALTWPWRPSNQIAPTPNCQLKSLFPALIRVLLSAVMVPATAVPEPALTPG